MKPYIKSALKNLISISGDRIQSNAVMFEECYNTYTIALYYNDLAEYIEKGLDIGT
jgi:hypothetical protein